jgi:hypothetical protein
MNSAAAGNQFHTPRSMMEALRMADSLPEPRLVLLDFSLPGNALKLVVSSCERSCDGTR